MEFYFPKTNVKKLYLNKSTIKLGFNILKRRKMHTYCSKIHFFLSLQNTKLKRYIFYFIFYINVICKSLSMSKIINTIVYIDAHCKIVRKLHCHLKVLASNGYVTILCKYYNYIIDYLMFRINYDNVI